MNEKYLIAEKFNAVAHQYEHHASLQNTIGEKLVSYVEGTKTNNLLDLGSGPGIFSELLTKSFSPECHVSLDIAFNMLKTHKQKNNLSSLICSDFDFLPFSDNSFSMIFSNMALQWSENIKETLKEIYRTLESNGILIFSTLGPSSLQELRTAWESVDSEPHCNDFPSEPLLRKYLELLGFSYSLQKANHVLNFPNVQKIFQHIKNYGGNHVFSRTKKTYSLKAFLKVIQAYEYFKKNDHYPLTYEVFYVVARKNS